MKATRQQPEPAFVPVILTLETQEEVDALHTLFNHARVTNAVGLPFAYDVLRPFYKKSKTGELDVKLCNC